MNDFTETSPFEKLWSLWREINGLLFHNGILYMLVSITFLAISVWALKVLIDIREMEKTQTRFLSILVQDNHIIKSRELENE
jgi:hypothetical protein